MPHFILYDTRRRFRQTGRERDFDRSAGATSRLKFRALAMGRLSYEAIGLELPGRRNLLATCHSIYHARYRGAIRADASGIERRRDVAATF